MDFLNLCLKVPNLGILLYYLIFVVIIPYLLISNNSLSILKFYMPMMVAFAHLLNSVGDKKIFGNLYDLRPQNFVSFVSSNFINLFTLFGILWQALENFKETGDLNASIVYGIVLFIIAFPFARVGLKFVLDNVDEYLSKKTNMEYKYNWHLVVFGLIYIIFILGLQAVVLGMLSQYKPTKVVPLPTKVNKVNNVAPTKVNKVNKINNVAPTKVNNVNNINNVAVNNKKNSDKVTQLNKFGLTSLSNIAKKYGKK